MKIYLSGERSELIRFSNVEKQIENFEHNFEIMKDVLSFATPSVLLASSAQADIFIFLMSKTRRPSSWTWYEFGSIIGAASARQNEPHPPKVLVCGKPELMVVEDWVIDLTEDEIIPYLSGLVKNPPTTRKLSGVVIEDDDGYMD